MKGSLRVGYIANSIRVWEIYNYIILYSQWGI